MAPASRRRRGNITDGDQASPSIAVHPGGWLRAEIVEPASLSVTALAERLCVTRQAASNLLNGHAGLSAEMAIRFEKAFGVKADYADAHAGGV